MDPKTYLRMLESVFGLPQGGLLSEYSMAELASQAYALESSSDRVWSPIYRFDENVELGVMNKPVS